jgi:hypothetical protein
MEMCWEKTNLRLSDPDDFAYTLRRVYFAGGPLRHMSLLRHGPARTELACPRIPLPHGRPDSQTEGEDRHRDEADDKKPKAGATRRAFRGIHV